MTLSDQIEELEEKACRICGCTYGSPCMDEHGQACHWVEEDLCSGCTLTTEDLAHYYGSKVRIQFPNADFYRNGEVDPIGSAFLSGAAAQGSPIEHKPVLRPLPDLTKKEAKWIARNINGMPDGWTVVYDRRANWRGYSHSDCYPELFRYLLSQHFDLFGWINDGLAIDATTLEPNPYGED